jgi:hypothetical protein
MSNIRVDIKRQDSTGTTSSSQSDDMGDLSFELAHGPTGSGATGLTPDRSEIIRRKKEEMRRRRQSMSMGVPPSFKDWGSIQSKPTGGRRKTRKHMSRRKNKTKKVSKRRNKTRRHKSRRNKKSKKHTKRRKQRGGGFFDFIFGKKEEEREQAEQTVSTPQPAQPVASAQPETQPTQVVDTPPEAESQ